MFFILFKFFIGHFFNILLGGHNFAEIILEIYEVFHDFLEILIGIEVMSIILYFPPSLLVSFFICSCI